MSKQSILYSMLILSLLFTGCCKTNPTDASKIASSEMIFTDMEMSDLAGKEGFYKALLLYADDSVVKFNEGLLPVIGKLALIQKWKDKEDPKTISWKPFKVEAALSGDLGYTLGNWQLKTKDSIIYGNYYTIWKKQKDGKWKFVIDGGNNSPAKQLE